MRAQNTNNILDDLEELPVDFFGFPLPNPSENYDVLSIGDAWLNYPMVLKDINDYLSLSYNIIHYDITKTYLGGNLLNQINRLPYEMPNPKVIILSFGFYDFIQLFSFSTKNNNLEISNLIDNQSQNSILYNLSRLRETNRPIIIHGYDYFLPSKYQDGWISNILFDKGRKENQNEDCRLVVDSLNDAIAKQFILQFPNLHYLDLRGTLNENDWYDELHPNNEGFRKLAEKFKAKIEEVLNLEAQKTPIQAKNEEILNLEAQKNPIQAKNEEIPNPKNKEKKILWVDDNPKGNIKLADELKKHDIQITDAINTDSAIEFLSQNTYDLIISDMKRGDESEAGMDFLKTVNILKIQTPFVIYTTMGYVRKYEKQALELGAFGVKSGKWNIMSKYFLEILS